MRRASQLIVGVALGLAVGDLLIAVLGTGPRQTGVIVSLAIMVAVAVRGSGALMIQAGGTAVLIATLTPIAPDLELPRTVNALLRGAVGLVILLVLAPLNPLRTVHRRPDAGRLRPRHDRLGRGPGSPGRPGR